MKIEIIRQIALSLDEAEWETVLAGLDALGIDNPYAEVPEDQKRTAARMHAEIVEELHKFNQR